MVDYAAEIDRIFEEHRRRSAILTQELEEIEQRTARTAYDLEARATADMRQFWDEHGEELEQARAEAEERERQEAEQREQREAIARAAAARKAEQNAAPADDDDDDYYRRESWLV